MIEKAKLLGFHLEGKPCLLYQHINKKKASKKCYTPARACNKINFNISRTKINTFIICKFSSETRK